MTNNLSSPLIRTHPLLKVGTEMGGGSILVTTGHPCDPTSHHSYAMLASTWCSSFPAEVKAIKKALQIIQTEESPKKSPNHQW